MLSLQILQGERFRQGEAVELYCQVIQSTQAYNVATRVIQPLKISIAPVALTILAGLSILATVSVAASSSP